MSKQSGSDEELGRIVESGIVALLRHPREKLFDAAKASQITLFGPTGQTSAEDRRTLDALYASADEVHRAATGRDHEIKGMVVALLIQLDPDLAADLLARALRRGLDGYPFGSWEMDLYYMHLWALHQVGARIPLPVKAELWLASRLQIDQVPEEAFAHVSLTELVRVCRETPRFSPWAHRLLARHPALRDGATVLSLLHDLPEAQRELRQKLVDRLGELKYAPAVPTLLAEKSLHVQGALGAIDTPEARRGVTEQIATSLEATMKGADGVVRVPLRPAIVDAPERASELLAAYFDDETLATKEGQRCARLLLAARGPGAQAPLLLSRDPRWLEVAARLLGGPLFEEAREFLATFDAKDVKAALKRAGYAAPAAPAPKKHPPPKKPGWLARYEKGEHEAVWAEIALLEDSAQDPAIVEEATAVARAMMGRVRQNLEGIVELLKKRKYKFAAKSAKKALLPPHAKAATHMKALEKIAGAPLPLSLRAFWEVVGSVDLTELDAAGDPAEGLGAMDPLLVDPPDLPLDLLKGRADHEKRLPAELRRAIRELTIGLDPKAKYDPEDGNDAPYEIEVVGSRADGVVRQGDREMTFVSYLREAIASGGFPGSPAPDDPERDPLKVRALLAKGRTAF